MILWVLASVPNQYLQMMFVFSLLFDASQLKVILKKKKLLHKLLSHLENIKKPEVKKIWSFYFMSLSSWE